MYFVNCTDQTCRHTFFAGLGDEVPDILQEGYVPIPTNAECRQSSPAYALILRDFHVCVGDGSPSACRVSRASCPHNRTLTWDGSLFLQVLTPNCTRCA